MSFPDAHIEAAGNLQIRPDAHLEAADNLQIRPDALIETADNLQIRPDAHLEAADNLQIRPDAHMKGSNNFRVRPDVHIETAGSLRVRPDAHMKRADNLHVRHDTAQRAVPYLGYPPEIERAEPEDRSWSIGASRWRTSTSDARSRCRPRSARSRSTTDRADRAGSPHRRSDSSARLSRRERSPGLVVLGLVGHRPGLVGVAGGVRSTLVPCALPPAWPGAGPRPPRGAASVRGGSTGRDSPASRRRK